MLAAFIRSVRFAVRAPLLLMLVLCGLLIQLVFFGWIRRSARARCIQVWSRLLLCITGLKLHLTFESERSAATVDAARTGALWCGNHVSWLDIFAVNAVRGAVFVAKADIASWPLVGWLVSANGTIFVNRGTRHAIREVNHQITQCLQRGELISVFPEGTTTDGSQLLAFHSNLIDPALKANVPIQAFALRYEQKGRFSSIPSYVGEQSLLGNLWLVLGHTDLAVKLHVFDPVQTEAFATRHQIAQHLHDRIKQQLQV